MSTFNQNQLAAINANNPTILASAGAGAGKTSVMTERVLRLIKDGKTSLDRMIVITFTNDAARSMSDKIKTKLQDEYSVLSLQDENTEISNRLRYSIDMEGSSKISTIHSFCGEIVRKGYYIVNVDSHFKIVEEGIRRSYFNSAVTDAVEAISKKGYPKASKIAFGAFMRAVPANSLVEVCYDVYNTLMGVSEPFSVMENLIEQVDLPYQDNPWAKELLSYYKNLLSCKGADLDTLKELASDPLFPNYYLPVLNEDISNLSKILSTIPSISSVEDMIDLLTPIVANTKPIRAIKFSSSDEAAKYEIFKKIHSYLKNKPTSSADSLNYLEYILSVMSKIKRTDKTNKQIKAQLKGLYVLLSEVHNHFSAIKSNNNVLDFSDLEQFAYQILTSKEHTEVRDEIHTNYTDVFVDECQDVSEIQYAIIQALKGPDTSLFMVGDIKQSIYRFRHADPLLFLSLRDKYSLQEDASERKIYFQHNYRSSAVILECVNAVFSSAMSRNQTEFDYEQGDHLLAGADKYDNVQTEVILIDDNFPKNPQPTETNDKVEAQCHEVGKRIQELVNSGFNYKDIVILLRARTSAAQICNWLSKLHIPSYYNGKQNFFEVPEVALLINVLKTIVNDHLDYPLIATLRNVLSFSDTELAYIRADYFTGDHCTFYDCLNECASANKSDLEKKAHDAIDLIHSWQMKARTSRASEIIWMLLKNHNIYAIQGAMPDGEIRQKNLYAFFQKAVDGEANGILRLSDFLDYINTISQTAASGGGDDPVPMSENDDFVRIMTIHSSKGLEFPVVFVMNMDRNIHVSSSARNIQLNVSSNSIKPALGFYMRYGHRGRNLRRDSYGLDAFQARAYMDELAEETRMLYVAMTRAEQRLYLVGIAKNKRIPLWNVSNNDYRIFNTTSMFDMVMPAVLNSTDMPILDTESYSDLWHISYTSPHPIVSSQMSTSTFTLPTLANNINFEAEWDSLKPSAILPAKAAVTSVLSEDFDLLHQYFSSGKEGIEASQVNAISLPEEPEKPMFMRVNDSLTSANVGSILHKFMSLINLSVMVNDKIQFHQVFESELTRLQNMHILSNDDVSVIHKFYVGISRFFHSAQGRSFASARNVRREQSVTFSFPVQGENILVQGIIDALYLDEQNQWVLIDYKSDKITDKDALINSHASQVNLYRYAIENITNIPVSKMLIVSLRSGMSFDVPRIL